MKDDQVATSAEVEYRFVCSLLRMVTKLLRPEVVGVAVLTAAAECGVPRKQALALMQRFMAETILPKGWRPWSRTKRGGTS